MKLFYQTMAYGICTPGVVICRTGADIGRGVSALGNAIEKMSHQGEAYCEERKAHFLDAAEIAQEKKDLEILEADISSALEKLEETRNNLTAAKASAPILEVREAEIRAKVEVLEKRRKAMVENLEAHQAEHKGSEPESRPVEVDEVETVPEHIGAQA